jgi:hypothetical protein
MKYKVENNDKSLYVSRRKPWQIHKRWNKSQREVQVKFETSTMVIKDTIWQFGKPRSYDYTTIIAISTRWVQLHGSIDVIKPRHVESYSCSYNHVPNKRKGCWECIISS